LQWKGADICVIGERLKSERERLGMTQPDFAEAAGAKKRTLIDWEKGVSSPTAVQLAALAGIGVDALYVLTGQPQGGTAAAPVAAPSLSRRAQALVENYEATSEEGKKIIEAAAFAAAKPCAVKRAKAA
jgi:transcriptional regulator with XRE-family HTH domain